MITEGGPGQGELEILSVRKEKHVVCKSIFNVIIALIFFKGTIFNVL